MTLTTRAGNVAPLNATHHDNNLAHFDDKTVGILSVKDYGAVGDGITDDTAAIQAAVDDAWAKAIAGNGIHRVLLPPGAYKISDSIRLFSNNGTKFDYTTFSFGGDARGYIDNKRTSLVPTFTDKPALIVQAARGTELSNFSIIGSANARDLPSYTQLLEDQSSPWWNTNGARDQKHSPYCGIAIDPFGSSSTGGNQYPDLDYYSKGNQGSTEIDIDNVECWGFIVGICVSPSESTQLGDSIVIRDCNLSYNRVAVSCGQSQNRGVSVENLHCKGAQVVFDTTIYGVGTGPMPNVIGGVIVHIKWLLSGNSSWGQASFINTYAESMWALGFWGSSSGGFILSFTDCHLKLVRADVGGGKMIDCHLNAGGPVRFSGGYLGFYNSNGLQGGYRRISIYNASKVMFDKIALDGEPVPSQQERCLFDNCVLRYSGQGVQYGIQTLVDGADISVVHNGYIMLPPGSRVIDIGGTDEYVSERWDNVSDSSTTITVNGDGTGSFTASNPGRFFVGAYVTTTQTWTGEGPLGALAHTYRYMTIGRVSSIVGSTVNLVEMALSYPGGTASPGYRRLPTYKKRSIGTLTNASPDITSVNPIAEWRVGDRINGTGIPAGATVVSIASSTITMSADATASGSVEIYDAKMYLARSFRPAAPTSSVWFQGDRVYNSAPSAGGVEGWVCTTAGAPGTWKAFGMIAN